MEHRFILNAADVRHSCSVPSNRLVGRTSPLNGDEESAHILEGRYTSGSILRAESVYITVQLLTRARYCELPKKKIKDHKLGFEEVVHFVICKR